MDAASGGGGMDEDAGYRTYAIGKLGTLVRGDLGRGGRGDGFDVGVVGVWGRGGLRDGIGLAGEGDDESLGCEEGAKAACEVEIDLLFGDVGGDLTAGVVAAVGGIEEDEVGIECGRLAGGCTGLAGFGPGCRGDCGASRWDADDWSLSNGTTDELPARTGGRRRGLAGG